MRIQLSSLKKICGKMCCGDKIEHKLGRNYIISPANSANLVVFVCSANLFAKIQNNWQSLPLGNLSVLRECVSKYMYLHPSSRQCTDTFQLV